MPAVLVWFTSCLRTQRIRNAKPIGILSLTAAHPLQRQLHGSPAFPLAYKTQQSKHACLTFLSFAQFRCCCDGPNQQQQIAVDARATRALCSSELEWRISRRPWHGLRLAPCLQGVLTKGDQLSDNGDISPPVVLSQSGPVDHHAQCHARRTSSSGSLARRT